MREHGPEGELEDRGECGQCQLPPAADIPLREAMSEKSHKQTHAPQQAMHTG